ncbi:hypothetical protein [Microtetraspora glauca]|uniref:GNAT family N-acetyltransferase n=1 Tax=Microtetraspora glauca TaxID=1996 RepID=A0ABV3GA63_MICGL
MKLTVSYEHDPADLSTIYLAVVPRGVRPSASSWRPALRDTVAGQRVVWIRVTDVSGVVWLRDRDGERQAQRLGA